MNKYIKAKFTRVRNSLMKSHSKSVAHKLIKKQIESGMLPKEFLILLSHKETFKEAREKLKYNLKLKNEVLRHFDFTCQDCKRSGTDLFLGVCPIGDDHKFFSEFSYLTVRCMQCRNTRIAWKD